MNLWEKVKKGVRKLLGLEDIEKVIHQKPAISADMFNAIQLWTQMYEGRASWLKDPTDDDPNKVVSLGLPSLIASEKARMATLEMESEITAPMVDVEKDNPDYEPPGFDENGIPRMGKGSMKITESEPVGSTERADFLNLQYKKVLKRIRTQLEYACAKGGIIIKPYLVIYDEVLSLLSSFQVRRKVRKVIKMLPSRVMILILTKTKIINRIIQISVKMAKTIEKRKAKKKNPDLKTRG